MDSVVQNETPVPSESPTALIEVLDAHDRMQSRYRLATEGSTCKIGRSVACDIVLDDPYAAPEHTAFVLLPDGRVSVSDLGSRNGTRLDGKLLGSQPTELTQGELIIGRTRVRIRTTLTELTPERLFRRDLLQRHRTILAAVGLALALGFFAFNRWVAFAEPLAPSIFTAVITALLAIGIWSGFWGLIARVIHGAWSLRVQIAIAATMVAVCVWSDWLIGVAIFAFQWRWLEAVEVVILACAFVGSLYLHLRKSTHLSVRTALIAAAAIPITVVGGAIWFAQENSSNDVNRIALGPNIYPPQLRVATSTDLGDYLATVDSLKRETNRKRRLSLTERPLAPSE